MPRAPFRLAAHSRGSALLIVIAFLLLLTTLTVAFLARATLERQLSNASFSQGKIDVVAQGAVASVIGDLQREIIAGSNGNGGSIVAGTTIPLVASGYYYPNSPLTVIPALVVPGFTSSTIVGTGMEDLLKISKSGSAFYSGTSYNTVAYPAPNRASAVNTAANPSLNNRSVSTVRWNKPLLMTPVNVATTATDFTPPVAFVAPDWIYVAQDGSNPTTWSATNTIAGSNPVTQRYAYAVYDEGSTLDLNVAGSPSTVSSGTVTYSQIQPYKNALAYADLTQLPGISSLSAANQSAVINAIVGWRNYTSDAGTTNVSGTFPGVYTFPGVISGTSLTPFDQNILSNPNGFLDVMSAVNLQKSANSAILNETDNAFTSRQQLLQFVLQGLGQNSTFNPFLSSLETALPCLGTFTRDLSQPSFGPSPAKVAAAPTTAIASGGNDLGAPGADAAINPSFLATTVTASYTRNDGSSALVGEPLVKKRFALSRLAWLTYAGPIATDNGTYSTATGISALVTVLKSYGYTDAFLLQGGPTNIYKYFGLSWVSDSRNNGDGQSKWVYNHEQATYPASLSAATGTVNHIRTLGSGTYTVVSQKRDPDFFELLKASITLGSLGKAYVYNGATPSAVTPAGYQQQRDNSADLQIVQIGANIIDQFQPSGYCSRILFTDGSLFGGTVQEIRGIEDMPYIYRIREGKITATDSSPTQANCPTTSQSAPNPPGLVAVLQEPEIWNPHAWSGVSAKDTLTRPTSFRIVAISTDPNSPSSTAAPVTLGIQCILQWATENYVTPYTPSTPSPPWKEADTELDFSIPQSTTTSGLALFREPTLLIKPSIPTGSGLTVGGGSLIASAFPAGYILSAWQATQIKGDSATDNRQYIGFLMGTGPAAWATTIPIGGVDGTKPTTASPGVVEATYASLFTAVNGITYRMQYQDSANNWVTYDEKYVSPVDASSYNNGTFWTDQNKTFNLEGTYSGGQYTTANNNLSQEIGEVGFDPRASRFGMQTVGSCGYRASGPVQFPVRASVNTIGWSAPTNTAIVSISNFILGPAIGQMALMTERPDQYAGFSFDSPSAGFDDSNSLPTASGWYPASTANTYIEPGMFTQNNPNEAANPAKMLQVRFDPQTVGSTLNQYFADADGVVRRAMAAYVPTDPTAPADPAPATGQPWGLPMKMATNFSTTPLTTPPSPDTVTNEYQSRPIMLNRPFRSVADLGYVFSDTPWRNLDVTTPESATSALLDVFCINDTSDPNGLLAGKVNLNTRQTAVLNAVLAGAYTDEFSPNATTSNSVPLLTPYVGKISAALVARTQSTTAGQGPLGNLSELVGKWNSSVPVGSSINGSSSYLGFSSDTFNNNDDLTTALANAGAVDAVKRVQRFRASPIRTLANTTTARVWNLMIDVIAQTGRFPSSASSLAGFNVEGERRYWVHVAIDRYTGKVLDEQAEEVKE